MDGLLLAAEAEHPYNPYITALERLRTALGETDEEVYLDLLRTRLEHRPGFVLGLGRARFGSPARDFLLTFGSANSALSAQPLPEDRT